MIGWAHRVPFNRLILAASTMMDIPLLTSDEVFVDLLAVKVVC
jgi:PIN domain nuclease of toxin-antitoxin system